MKNVLHSKRIMYVYSMLHIIKWLKLIYMYITICSTTTTTTTMLFYFQLYPHVFVFITYYKTLLIKCDTAVTANVEIIPQLTAESHVACVAS